MFFATTVTAQETSGLSRGEATDLTVKYLNLEKNNQRFLTECQEDIGLCLFTFSTRTNFPIRLDPLILYPDVYPAYRYYKSINMASELDLVRGYFEEENSPFRPEQPITRVEALKLALGATNVMDWKEKFELAKTDQPTKNWLVFNLDSQRWWYGRYLAAAESNGFWQHVSVDQAEQGMSKTEFLNLLENANKIVASRQTSSWANNYRQSDPQADTSGNITF